jgi:hypothetical protein
MNKNIGNVIYLYSPKATHKQNMHPTKPIIKTVIVVIKLVNFFILVVFKD